MASSEIQISSNALLLIGDNSISAYAETRGGLIAQALFDSVVENMLAIHTWRFAIRQQQLGRLTSGPAEGSLYSDAFQLPAGYIRTVQVRPNVSFDIIEDQLHANVSSLMLECVYRPDVATWPPWFVKLMEYQMAAELANPVTEDAARADFWAKKAMDQLTVAMSMDSLQRPNVAIDHNPIFEAHY